MYSPPSHRRRNQSCPRRRAHIQHFGIAILVLIFLSPWHNHGRAVAQSVDYFNIGVNLPFSSDEYGQTITRIVDLIRVLHENTTILNRLESTTAFRLYYTATSQYPSTAIAATINAVRRHQLHAIIGDDWSRVSIPTMLAIGTTYKTWACSGSSSSTELSDKADFGRFFRTIPDDPQCGKAMASFVANMGWRIVATLSCTDGYGAGLSAAFYSSAIDLGITVKNRQVFPPEAQDLTKQLTAIKLSGARIIVYLGISNEATTILLQARDMGLVGPDYVWIASEGTLDMFTRAIETETIPLLKSASNGLMVVYPAESKTPLTIELEEAWNRVYPGEPVVPYAHMYADCALALARGLVQLKRQYGYTAVANGLVDQGNLSAFIQPNVGFTSSLVFNSLGDRQGEYQVFNFWSGEYITAFQVYPNQTQLQLAEPKFWSGSSDIPPDRPMARPQFADWPNPSAAATATLTAAILVAIAATSGYLAQQRKSVIVAHVSPAFLALVSMGSMLCLASVFLQIGFPTSASCSAEQWLGLSGMSLLLGATVVKAYKCWKVFDNIILTSKRKVKSNELLSFTTALLCLQSFILIVAGVLAPTKITIASPGGSPYFKCAREGPTQLTTAITALQLVLVFGPAVVAHYLAFETKNCSPALAESTWLVYGIDSMIICVSALVPFHLLDLGGPRLLAAQWIKIALTLYGVSFTYFALAGRIAFMLLMGRTDNLIAMLNDPDALVTLNSNKFLTASARGRAESSGHTSSHQQRIGASKASDEHLGGVYAIKQAGKLLSTWRVHQVSVCFQLGTVSLTPCYFGAVRDHHVTHFSLADASFSPNVAGLELCIKFTRRRSKEVWLIQLLTKEEHELWIHGFIGYQDYLSAVLHRSGGLAHSKQSLNQQHHHLVRGEATVSKVSAG